MDEAGTAPLLITSHLVVWVGGGVGVSPWFAFKVITRSDEETLLYSALSLSPSHCLLLAFGFPSVWLSRRAGKDEKCT
jgi:hypothetical protein